MQTFLDEVYASVASHAVGYEKNNSYITVRLSISKGISTFDTTDSIVLHLGNDIFTNRNKRLGNKNLLLYRVYIYYNVIIRDEFSRTKFKSSSRNIN